MQGRKQLKPKLMYQVCLEDLVPQDNFYLVLMAATCYNLKKYLRFIRLRRQTAFQAMQSANNYRPGMILRHLQLSFASHNLAFYITILQKHFLTLPSPAY